MFTDVLPWLLLGLVTIAALGLVVWFAGSRNARARSGSAAYQVRPSERPAAPASPLAAQPQPPQRQLPVAPAPSYDQEPARRLPPQQNAVAAPQSRDPGVLDVSVPQQMHAPPPPLPRRQALGSSFPAPTPPPPAVIEGHVREADGSVIAGASLTLIDLAGGQIGRGATGRDGAYSLPVPSAGSYFLITRARAHHPQASTVTVADQPVSLAIVLTGLAELVGVVRVAGGDEPVPCALVTLLDVRGEVIGSISADSHGRYRFAELVGGAYTLAASASPFRPAARLVTVADTGPTAQDIELSAGAHLRGVAVAGRELRPVQDARVALLDADGNVVRVARTDVAGEYLFNDVPEGHYTLQASGYPVVQASLQVFSGRKHEQDIELGYPDD